MLRSIFSQSVNKLTHATSNNKLLLTCTTNRYVGGYVDRFDKHGEVASQFNKHEQLMEFDYVNKEERRLIQSLLERMQSFAAPSGPESIKALESVLNKHGIPVNDTLKEDLVMWKSANKGADDIDESMRP